MTILSNHRLHTYKSSASICKRDLSPKKTPLQNKNTFKRNGNIISRKNTLNTKPLKQVDTPNNVAVMQSRTITVWNNSYQVNLPEEIDIYEGLRLLYPNLYKEMCEEIEAQRIEAANDELDCEEAWNHYDYLEWFYD